MYFHVIVNVIDLRLSLTLEMETDLLHNLDNY